MTHPITNALAMRTAAAETARTYRDRWRCANGFEGFATGAKIINEAILALPLEADHKALLDEAVRLPEIAALIEAVNLLGLRKLVTGWSGETVGASYEPHPPRLGVTLKTNCGTVYKIDAALKALETP